MPTPSPAAPGNINLRPDLTDAFEEFDVEMEKQKYIGTQVFPTIEVGLQADNPGKIKLEEVLRKQSTERASDGGYARGDYKFERWQYVCEEHGFEVPVSQRDEIRYRHILNADRVAASVAMGTVTRNFEQRVADALFNTTTWTGSALTTAVTTPWSDLTSSTPQADVKAARQKVFDQTGYWPNTIVMSYQVFENLINNNAIKDDIASQGAGESGLAGRINEQKLAEVFNTEKVVVGGSAKNTADRGQSRAISHIWNPVYVAVCVTTDSSNIREPCVGRTFHWGEDGSDIGGAIEEYWCDRRRQRIIRCRMETDEVVMYKEMSHLLSNITA